jgi:L-lactate dehydrogenase complex protein LldF
MSMDPERYRDAARRAVSDRHLHQALKGIQERLGKGALAAYQKLPEGPGLRREGARIRSHAIENLDVLLEELAAKVRARGGHVHFAADAAEARAYCLEVAARNNVRLAVKGKSMLTEEIGLNQALEGAGIEAVETDLGEYIVQLAGHKPSHIISPAIHLTRYQIGELFAEKLGVPYSDDPPTLTGMARRALRWKFLAADMGITGGNLACAETGHLALVSNEGNIRMATTLPRVHVALMGMERIAASLADHATLLRLLTRGAAAQDMSTYVTYTGGPRQPGETDGPEEFHLVIVDNGRMRILADPEFREILQCIRCGGCLNVCPVYGKIGGHSYGSPYPGPLGAVITPLFAGIHRSKDLCLGETLCGACKDVCPVDNDLPRMLSALRARLAYGDAAWDVPPAPAAERAGYAAWAWVMGSRTRYEFFLKMGRLAGRFLPRSRGMLCKLPGPLAGWTRGRDLPPLAGESFAERWKKKKGQGK